MGSPLIELESQLYFRNIYILLKPIYWYKKKLYAFVFHPPLV